MQNDVIRHLVTVISALNSNMVVLSVLCGPSSVYNPAVFCVGYAFLLFQDESSVQALIDACIEEDGKLYLCVSSPTIKDKPVSENTHRKHTNLLVFLAFF